MGQVREPTQQLLDRAGRGEVSARDQLLERYRERLKRTVALRLDDRVAARLDASDIVQETLATAALRLDEYLAHRPMPFLDWLKRLARDRVIDAHRTHIIAERRSVIRENSSRLAKSLSNDEVSHGLDQNDQAERLQTSERLGELQDALNLLRPSDRQIIIMRHFENLTPAQIANHFQITEGAAKVRTVRALLRLREILSDR
jgi:RNA polymerase sigma-70 factor (ECF subfamily)